MTNLCWCFIINAIKYFNEPKEPFLRLLFFLGGDKLAILNKKTNSADKPISYTQVSQIPLQDKDIFISTQRTIDLLKKIATEPNKFKAIETLIDETPDGKQAYNIFLRLANQGVTIEAFNKNTNRKLKKYDAEIRSFCARMGKNNSGGLDGLLDQLHGSSVARGGMACEVVVNEDATDVDDVILVDPATFVEYKYLENERRYAIYQNRTDGKKIDLYEGNFFFVPHMPKAGRPDGTLQFLPAIATMTQFYQLFADSMRILNRIGYPRYDVSIDAEALLNSLPPNMKNSVEQQQKAFKEAFEDVCRNLRSIGKDSDIVHFSSNKIEVIGGGVNGAGIDVRAWFEVLEPLVVNAFSMTPVLLGRLNTGSYSLGTVEFKIVTDTVDSMRRGSKRILEEALNLWARVKGYPIYIKVNHKPINWEIEKEKLEVELKKMEKARRAEEYCWISHDQAAIDGYGAEKADSDDTKSKFEYLSKSFDENSLMENQNNNQETLEGQTAQNNLEKDETIREEFIKRALREIGIDTT